eukprot:1445362-Pyramimonas_sp.AAC.1
MATSTIRANGRWAQTVRGSHPNMKARGRVRSAHARETKAYWTNCKHCGAPHDRQFHRLPPRPGLPASAVAGAHGADGAGGGPRASRAPGRAGVAPDIGLDEPAQAAKLMEKSGNLGPAAKHKNELAARR